MAEALENTTATDRICLAPNPVRSAENEARPSSRQTKGKGRSMRIALIHGDSIVRLNMQELLSRMHRMEVVGQHPHCNQVLKLIKGLRPDLVVLDITMPRRRTLDVFQSAARLQSRGMSILVFERFPRGDVPGRAEQNRFGCRFAYYQPARIGPTLNPIFVLQPELYGVLRPQRRFW